MVSSCSEEGNNIPDNIGPDVESIQGFWTIEDPNCGAYLTFEFKENGEYTLTSFSYPFSDLDLECGYYTFDKENSTLSLRHFYNDYDMDYIDCATNITLGCNIKASSLTLYGTDCYLLDLESPTVFHSGKHSETVPNFRDLLLKQKSITQEFTNDYGSTTVINREVFNFSSEGLLEYSHSLTELKDGALVSKVTINATGSYKISGYKLICNLTDVSKTSYPVDTYLSDSIAALFENGKPTQMICFLSYNHITNSEIEIYH